MTRPLTAEELATALAAAPNDDYDWPYIDAEHGGVIDGSLSPVCEWLVEHYEIRLRRPE